MRIGKPPKPKKADLVRDLQDKLTEEHWELIHQLVGREIKPTSRANFLSSLFHKTIKTASAKDKGRELQKFACEKISQAIGLPWGKDEEIASREGGQPGSDVRLGNQARRLFPFTVECKSGSNWTIPAALGQAKANLYSGTCPMVIINRPSLDPRHRVEPLVILEANVFFWIWKTIIKSGTVKDYLCNMSKEGE